MKEFLTVMDKCSQPAASEFSERRSRFLGFAFGAQRFEEVLEFVAQMRKEHHTAAHVCYACILDGIGNEMRFSDDGEPQSTAGIPILEVLKNKKLMQSAVVCVRFFGGKKLGVGGLVRAYSRSAIETLERAQIATCSHAQILSLTVDFAQFDGVEAFLQSQTGACEIIEKHFGADVTIKIALKFEQSAHLIERLNNLTFGKSTITHLEEKPWFFAFESE